MKKSSEGSARYRVALTETAKSDAGAIYDRIVDAAPHSGLEWFNELMDCVYSLQVFPYRCALAREAPKVRRQIRCLLFGKRRNIYRILYEVNEASKSVWILHIRHGALRDIKASDITTPEG